MNQRPRNYPGKHPLMILIVGVLIFGAYLSDHSISNFELIDFAYVVPIIVAAILLPPLESFGAGLMTVIFEFASEGSLVSYNNMWSGAALVGLSLVLSVTAYYVKRFVQRLGTAGNTLENSPLAYAEFEFPGYAVLGQNDVFRNVLSARGQENKKPTVFNSFEEKKARELANYMDQAINARSKLVVNEFHLGDREGRARFWNISLIPEKVPGRRTAKSVSLLASDVTDAVQRARSRDAALRISSAVMSSLNLQDTIQVVLDSLAYIAQTNAGGLFLIEDDQWIGVAGWGEYDDEMAQKLRWPYDDLPTGVEAVDKKQAIAIEDAARDERFSTERIHKFSIQSSLVVPLVAGNRKIGAAWLNQTDDRRHFSDEQIEFATVIGAQGALAIENAAIYENERQMRKSLEAIEAVSEVGLASLDLDEVLIELVTRTQDVMQMDAAMIFLADENGEWLEVRAATGAAASSVIGVRVAVAEQGLASRAYREGAPMKIDDMRAQPADQFCPSEEFKNGECPFSSEYGIRSALAVPLRPGGKKAGVLQLGSQRVGAFSAREWGLIQVLADRASMAVQNSLLHDATRKELARVALLRDVASACANSHDIVEIANKALTAVFEQLGCHRCSVYYLDTELNALVNLAFLGHTADVMESYRVSYLDRGTLLVRAVLEKRIITHNDLASGELTDKESEVPKALDVLDNRRCTVPIMYKGEAVGGMALVFPDRRPFSDSLLETIRSIANQLAVAIHSCELPQFDPALAEAGKAGGED